MRRVDIIVPVYKGFDETVECIVSVYKSIPDWAQLIVVNDCSPDQELSLWLQDNAKKYNFHLYVNEENLGFVKTVNFGMQLNPKNDVLLLNSDVEVPHSDWLERIRNAAYSKDKLASITPFSNNATICSFPHFCEDNELFSGLNTTELDNGFSKLELHDNLVQVPTGVGFCMYINRKCLNIVGYFDAETFGKGYGEENDWCQRAEKMGWLNYHQLNVFAYHKGGVSFEEEGDPRKENALNLLADLHPEYERDVHLFIQKDPAEIARNKALWGFLRESKKQKILFISHNLGGGVKQHTEELYSKYREDAEFVQIVPGTNGESVILSFFSAGSELKYKYEFILPSDYEDLIKLLKFINLDRIHFHHTMGLPINIFALKDDLLLDYDLTVHDYYLINGNPTLTDESDKFIGDIDLESLDEASSKKCLIPCSGDVWRRNNQKLIGEASRVIFPSMDTFNRFNTVFEMSKNQAIVAYHPDSYDCTEFTLTKGSGNKILILGALGKEKGADVLEAVAKSVNNVEFHLLGYAYRVLNSVITHGPYELENLNNLIKEINPSHIWFPAQWPETYSYTLSTALCFDAPIIYPNLGAFPERTKERSDSICLPWNYGIKEFCKFFRDGIKRNDIVVENKWSENELIDDFYNQGYLNFNKVVQNDEDVSLNEIATFIINKNVLVSVGITSKEKILLMLWKLSSLPIVKNVTNIIPYKLQRKIKRTLSLRPMNEVLNK